MCTGDFKDPDSLKKPGPRDGTIKCFIKRDKSNMTYHLYLCLSSDLLDENGKFLLSAKGRRRITCRELVISMDAENISRSSDTYVGKLRSNFLGNKYMIYDTQPPPYTSEHVPPPSRKFNSNKVSPKVPTGINYSIGQITYNITDALRKDIGPRVMHCVMHSVPASALDPDQLLMTSPEDSFCSGMSFSSKSSLDDHSTEIEDIGSLNEEADRKVKKPLVLKNKPPRWHEKRQCWGLDFRGRVTVASFRNFQLLADIGPTTAGPTTSQSDQDKVILQFGKVGKDMFTMDYKYPLSVFQAFAICLSSLDTPWFFGPRPSKKS